MVLYTQPTPKPKKPFLNCFNTYIYKQLSRCCTARGSSTRFSLLGPTKIKGYKSFLFTEKFPCIKKEHLVDLRLLDLFYKRSTNLVDKIKVRRVWGMSI